MRSNAADEAIRGDAGWWPMKGRRDFARLRFWHKIVNLPEDRLLKRVYRVCKTTLEFDRSSWIFATRNILESLNLGHVWFSDESGCAKEWGALVRNCLHAYEVRAWKAGMEKKTRILRVYQSLKMDLKREEYLALPLEQRSCIAVMRSGTNNLRIETGRWRGEALENRICMLCGTGAVEDETHLLISCDIYTDLRQQMYQQIEEMTNWRFQPKRDDPRWILEASLGCGVGDKKTRAVIYSLVARFIRAAMKQREKLLNYFKHLRREARKKELDSAFLLVGRGGDSQADYILRT